MTNVDLNRTDKDYPAIIRGAGLNGFGEQPQPPDDTVPKSEYDAMKAKYEELVSAVKNLAQLV